MGQVLRVIEGGLVGADGGAKPGAKPPLSRGKNWLNTSDLRELAGISKTVSKDALRARRWRGVDLQVREVKSEVGQGGKILQVNADTLPSDLKEKWYRQQGIDLHEKVDPITGKTVLVAARAKTKVKASARGWSLVTQEEILALAWIADVFLEDTALPEPTPGRPEPAVISNV